MKISFKPLVIGILCLQLFACKKVTDTDPSNNQAAGEIISSNNESETGNQKILKDIYFNDRLDFDHAITQSSSNESSRQLIPFIETGGSTYSKYMLIEYLTANERDITNFEYLVSPTPITSMDLFSLHIYNDSVIVVNESAPENTELKVQAKISDKNYELDESYQPLAMANNENCMGGIFCIDWYLVLVDKVTGFIVSETFVTSTCVVCGTGEPQGGGGSNLPPVEETRNEAELITWKVGDGGGMFYWAVESTEELRGISYPNSSPKKESIFTAINHQNIILLGHSAARWNLGGVSINHNPDKATSSVQGWITYVWTSYLVPNRVKNKAVWYAKKRWP